ncbi:type II/IV secretion system protein, partial [Patescibacteria group bacterium]|nr:type II/IV secretion system protein [Patescibacteria group bacterium]
FISDPSPMPVDPRSSAFVHITGANEAEKFSEKMHELALKAKEREAEKHAVTLGIPYINLVKFPIAAETLSLIPREQAVELKAICFLNLNDELRVGSTDPKNPAVQELLYQLQERARANGQLYLLSEHSFATALKLYDALPNIKKIIKGVQISEDDIKKFSAEIGDFQKLNTILQRAQITDVVTLIVAAALQAKTSDIHVEAEEKTIAIRFRLDGVLTNIATLPHDLWPRVISRIKLLATLKINVNDRPQDGRFTIFLKDDKVDVRVSTIPTSYGESVVMRLLRSTATGLQFEDLGIRGVAFEELKRQVERPNGMIVTTGPTGSGKTTTLYAVLNKLNGPDMKIITLEDPVEYKLAGINQSQIDASHEYTFAKGLRSILRQDPDVVMVGEIRDLETAETAIQAALTGHLVVSTIHTNSAAGAIPRFLSMGVKGFLLAPALNAVIGQRLVRRICQECKVEDVLAPDVFTKAKDLLGKVSPKSGYTVDTNALKFWKGSGCSACNKLGFKGRIGVYEVLVMNKEIEGIILSGATSEYQMEEVAMKEGMVTMAQDGLLKALDGLTSVEEVFRVAE